MPDVEVSETVKATATRLYELVSDLPRMGEWSPENTGGKWLGGATGPAAGTKFHGSNRAGWRRWSTTVTVTSAEPGRWMVFDVETFGVPLSTWEYELTERDGACTVTERWTDRRPGWMRTVAVPVTGVRDRVDHNRRNMQETLQRLKASAESA
ncbi:MAG: SRPBCC family protein [Gaiellaceae bacterium]